MTHASNEIGNPSGSESSIKYNNVPEAGVTISTVHYVSVLVCSPTGYLSSTHFVAFAVSVSYPILRTLSVEEVDLEILCHRITFTTAILTPKNDMRLE